MKVELPYDPVVRSWYPEKMKALIRKDMHIPVFMTDCLHMLRDMEAPSCLSVNEWMKKCGTCTVE